jgi:hypothetical protein
VLVRDFLGPVDVVDAVRHAVTLYEQNAAQANRP